jgi:hypothetical protein
MLFQQPVNKMAPQQACSKLVNKLWGYKLRGQHVDPFFHCSIWLCYICSNVALAHEKQNLNQVHAL